MFRNPFTSPMTKSEADVWEEKRAVGRRRFLWRAGALMFGLPFSTLSVVLILWEVGSDPRLLDSLWAHIALIAVGSLLAVLCCMLGGIGAAWCMWITFEKRYQAARQLLCPYCRYSLRGLNSETNCPECGRAVHLVTSD